MATNSNYYGYSSGVQQSQVYGSTLQSPQVAQTGYTAQSTTGYGAAATTPAATNPYGAQVQASQARVINTPQTQTAYVATGATSYPQAGMSGSSYGYTARVQETTPIPAQSYQTTAYSAQTPTSYYDGRDTTASSTASLASYDATKTNSYYAQQQSTPTQQSYGYGSTTPATTKNMYATQQSHYSSPSVPIPNQTTQNIQGSASSVQKSHTQAPSSNVSGNVSYPYSTGKQHSNYNQGQGSYNNSSNWNNGGNMNNYQQTQGYDAAVYNAASSYFHGGQQQPRQKWNNRNQNNSNKPSQPRQQKIPPKQQQLHYCDVCKISCAGPQTYKEHLEGQKHKKKEIAAKQMAAGDGYKCTLCDVICTGSDAFNAHLKGSKHLKTMKLHTKLGKPIPDIPSAEVQDKEKKKDEPKEMTPRPYRNQQRKRKSTTPKITFIGGSALNTSNEGSQAAGAEGDASSTPATPTTPQDGEQKEGTEKEKFVGEDYIEEVKGENGKVTGFECKLCDCKFNDQGAREAHLSGRRHKLSYKKKVQPSYVVDTKAVKGTGRQQHKPLMDDKSRRKWEQEMYWKKQEANWRQEEVRSNVVLGRWGEEEYWRRLEEEERMWEEQEHQRHEVDMMDWERRNRMGPPDMFNAPRPRQDSQDDRVVMSKHKLIYPNEQELVAVQNIVSAVEKALKLVSDNIAIEDTPPAPVAEAVEDKVEVQMEVTEPPTTTPEEKPEEKTTAEEGDEAKTVKPKEKVEPPPPRTLKGVMRVGVLAKGLLLHEKLDVELVVLCQERPTRLLLNRVYTKLPEHIAKVSEEKYNVAVVDNTIMISTAKEPEIKIVITLTSPAMRDDAEVKEEHKDVLDKDKCLEALASLRHAKWFQAKANGVPSCVVIIRILRDMRSRVPSFSPLSSWAMELLVEKCLSSADRPLGPGEAFRRVMECIASGILSPGGSGLQDPCEKEQTNAAHEMTTQEGEDLTAAAQYYLRQQAFRQLHKVLGVDPLPPSKYKSRYGRGGSRFKRRREESGQGDGQGDANAKKEKKDGEDAEAATAPTKEASEAPPAKTLAAAETEATA